MQLSKFLAHHRTMAKNYKLNNAKKEYDFFSFENYHPLKEIYGYLKAVQRKYPSITEIVKIGASYEEFFQIGKVKTNRIVWIDAGMHAREWIGPATAVFFINQLTENYGKIPTVTELVNKFNFYILPVLNPDGYEYSWTTVNNQPFTTSDVCRVAESTLEKIQSKE
ncbi:Peptidase M14 domain containing protein [Trichuris trichiura]|uniref:Peptidase M14 domain containing protein n=1 Tax=Trichuris trichiura TaxID=36087 RepID=A0A077YWE9_TRITR|nr:Peptidase M14 domain containing protein [Trichuris trichiura]